MAIALQIIYKKGNYYQSYLAGMVSKYRRQSISDCAAQAEDSAIINNYPAKSRGISPDT